MSKDKYLPSNLTIPSDMELFKSNINTDGLNRFIEKVNAKHH